jgi:NADPH-dependent curcumin reductase
MQGFLILDYQPRFQEAWTRLATWYLAEVLKYHYDIVEGLENTPRRSYGY